MYVLVFWLDSKDISVVEENDLHPSKEEGEMTKVVYNDRLYQAKIIIKSEDKQYLSGLKVNTDGDIIRRTESILEKELKDQKKVLKQKSKLINKKKEDNKNSIDHRIINSPSIFEDVETELEEEREKEREREQEREQEEIFDREKERERDRNEIRQKEKDQVIEQEEICEKEREKMRRKEQEEMRERERERDREGRRRREQESSEGNSHRNELERREDWLRREQDRDREDDRDRNRRAVSEESEDGLQDEVDPLEACRIRGNGMLLLCDTYKNVWVDKGDLTYLQRWFERNDASAVKNFSWYKQLEKYVRTRQISETTSYT